jgi:hypothetical protein
LEGVAKDVLLAPPILSVTRPENRMRAVFMKSSLASRIAKEELLM